MRLRKPIYVIGEGITEKPYFQHLKKLREYNVKLKPRLAKNSSIDYIKREVDRLLEGDVIVISVLDADTSQKNSTDQKKICTTSKFLKNYKNKENLILSETLPSIEFWFLLHFISTHKKFDNYRQLRDELRIYISEYDKKEDFLKMKIGLFN